MPPSPAPLLVTGGAGFIGSCLVDRLIAEHVGEIRVFDDFSSGRREFLRPAAAHPRFRLIQGDLRCDQQLLREAVRGCEAVFHLAANPDARRGLADPRVDFDLEILATFNILEAMRCEGVRRIVLSSSGTIYGETPVIPLDESYGPVLPISIYGAGKLASEGLLTAYSGSFGFQVWIYRFGNVVGPRSTHGIIKDLAEQLKSHPTELPVLGNGTQCKPYLHVTDCVDGILFGWRQAQNSINLFNLAVEGATTVRWIAEELLRVSGREQETRIVFQSGDRGWPGDVPQSRLCVDKMSALGWRVRMSSDAAVARAIREVCAEVGVLGEAVRA